MTRGKRMGENDNPNHSGYATFSYTGSRYLNLGKKNSKYKCKKAVVYLQLITAKWHIENGKK